MKAILSNLISGIAGALLVLAVQYGAGGPSSAAPVSGVQDCVTARKLVIVDGDGKERISAFVDSANSNTGRIVIYNPQFTRQVEMSGGTFSSDITVYGEKGGVPLVSLFSSDRSGCAFVFDNKTDSVMEILPGGILSRRGGTAKWKIPQ